MAKQFHEVYEFNSSIHGWKTQKNCRVPFDKLPKKNKEVMLKTCKILIPIFEKRFGFIYSDSNKCPKCKYDIIFSDVKEQVKEINQGNKIKCPSCKSLLEVVLDVSVVLKKIVLEKKK